jgi:hypothetical protein
VANNDLMDVDLPLVVSLVCDQLPHCQVVDLSGNRPYGWRDDVQCRAGLLQVLLVDRFQLDSVCLHPLACTYSL